MRTTVEIPDEQRARLLQLAALRGEKGFSTIVQEALEMYLNECDQREGKKQRAISVLGTLDEGSAQQMRDEIKKLRNFWR